MHIWLVIITDYQIKYIIYHLRYQFVVTFLKYTNFVLIMVESCPSAYWFFGFGVPASELQFS